MIKSHFAPQKNFKLFKTGKQSNQKIYREYKPKWLRNIALDHRFLTKGPLRGSTGSIKDK